ncbi:MAG: hypothetical protein JYX80_11715 [Candidatus Scalindua sediminis]|nr:hypothetical protein [Candidatus Scalindua sediminis]
MANSPNADWWARSLGIVGTIGVVVASFSLCINYRTSNLHLEPSIKCFLEKADNNQLRFSIKNDGPIDASLLSVAYYVLMYYPEKKIISVMEMQSAPLSKVPGTNWLYVKNLEPNERKSKLVGDNRNQERNYIFIYLLKSHFYRQKDMKLFTRESIFFADRNKIYSHDEFKERSDYKHIRQQMDTTFQKVINGYKRNYRFYEPFVTD